MSIWVGHYEPLELFGLWTEIHQIFFSPNVEEIMVDLFFRCSIHRSIREDIRDHSRMLSKITPKCGRFLALPNFWERAFQKLYARYHPCLAARRVEKFREDTPTILQPRSYTHTLKFRPDF